MTIHCSIPPLIPTQVTRTLPIFVIAMTISLLAFFNSLRLCIHVEKAASLRRFSARAKGRGAKIEKQTCHVYVTVGDTKPGRR